MMNFCLLFFNFCLSELLKFELSVFSYKIFLQTATRLLSTLLTINDLNIVWPTLKASKNKSTL